MKKNIITIVVFTSFILFGCKNKKKEDAQNNQVYKEISEATKINSKGYALMKTNCFVCHMEKPDPSKRGQMIAPPMLRVQEHYKPSYPNKTEFVEAVIAWVKNPSEDKVMMPGAVRKFNVMPKIVVKDEELKLIAETLYDIDFGNMPKMNMEGNDKLTLNNGKKWQLNADSKKVIKAINKQLNNFKSNDVTAYNQLGKDVFSNAKKILLDKTYDDKTFGQIQKFFHNIEGNMHGLIAAKSIPQAEREKEQLIKKMNQFNTYFQ